MADYQNFRSAFHGFNRQDVVSYIEFVNQRHNSQLEQLRTQLQNVQEELELAKAEPRSENTEDLRNQLDQALARCEELERRLAASAPCDAAPVNTELEAYRRAERAERKAEERAAQIYNQANAVLADITAKVESASEQMNTAAADISANLEQSRRTLQDAVAAISSIRPASE